MERIGFHIIRLQRAGRFEPEFITQQFAVQPVFSATDYFKGPVVTQNIRPSSLSPTGAITLVSGFRRYETAIENRLYRAINQLERLQRTRKGEFVPAPESVDVYQYTRNANPSREPCCAFPRVWTADRILQELVLHAANTRHHFYRGMAARSAFLLQLPIRSSTANGKPGCGTINRQSLPTDP